MSTSLRFFSRVLRIILRSLFMYGLSSARKGSTLLQLVFTVVAIYGATQNVWKALLVFALTALLYCLLRIEKLLLYSLLVTLIPSLWLALSNALIVFLKMEML